MTRVSEDPSSFVPQNNPKTGEWFWIDVPAMATSLDLPSDTPLVEVSLPFSATFYIAQRPYASDFPTFTLDRFVAKRGWYLCLAAAFELSILAAAHAAFALPIPHCVMFFKLLFHPWLRCLRAAMPWLCCLPCPVHILLFCPCDCQSVSLLPLGV